METKGTWAIKQIWVQIPQLCNYNTFMGKSLPLFSYLKSKPNTYLSRIIKD